MRRSKHGAAYRLRRFLRTPKGLLLLVLGALTLLALGGSGLGAGAALRLYAPGLGAATGAAMLLEVGLWRWKTGGWQFPDGALLTGLIVAAVLSPQQPWYVAAATSAVGIAAKYLLRTRTANIFNPAALGLVGTFYWFHTGQNWWGALPDLSWYGLAALLGGGIFMAARVNKLALVLSFLGAYYGLITLVAFGGGARGAAELYRTPDLQAALYFAFFILTDPPTSPPKYRQQWWAGAVVAGVAVAFFAGVGAAYYLLAGVLAGNAMEAARSSPFPFLGVRAGTASAAAMARRG